MKTVREFKFLRKECGFYNAIFYVYYKAILKFQNLYFIKNKREKRKLRLQKIYSVLYLLSNKTCYVDGNRFIEKLIDKQTGTKVFLRPFTSDLFVFDQIFEKQEYKAVVEIYNQMFKNAPLNIVDCGSNIGLASIYFNLSYPEAKFLAVEPFKKNLDVLHLNFKNNSVKSYTVMEAAVWNKNTGLVFNRNFRDGSEWSVTVEETATEKKDVSGISIVDLLGNKEIDILKIDIEGAEKTLFKTAEYAALFLKHVKCIAIEIHDEAISRQNIYEVFRLNNFFYFNANETTIAINRSYL